MTALQPPSLQRWSARALRPLAAACAALLLVGCVDAPTAPAIAEWLAGDEQLRAILPPAQLPASSAWLDASAAPRPAALARLLEEQAEAALGRGGVAEAARFRAEAASVVASSLEKSAASRVVGRAAESVDRWLDAAHGYVGRDPSPGSRALVDPVAQHRESAATRLAAGDTLAAARILIQAAEEIRVAAPRLAVVRVLEMSESRLATLPAGSRQVERVRRLIREARFGLDGDDPVRALRRAVYAYQIAGGQQLGEVRGNE